MVVAGRDGALLDAPGRPGAGRAGARLFAGVGVGRSPGFGDGAKLNFHNIIHFQYRRAQLSHQ